LSARDPATLTQPTPRLREVTWLWRRLWSFGVTFGALAIVAGIVMVLPGTGLALAQAVALQQVAFALIGLIVFVGLIYVVGATAYELVQLVEAAKVDRARSSEVAR
jgi:hypothetical protein